jgi:hypothetical protein
MTTSATTASPLHPEIRDDRGSLPLALLVIIATSGLLLVLVQNTIASQRQATFDRSYNEALPVADAGLEVSLATLNADQDLVDGATGTTHRRGEFPVGATTAPITLPINGEDYTWTLRRESILRWTASSTSTVRGVTRTVEAQVDETGLVNFAAFTDTLMELGGANTVDSYSSTSGAWCTRFGTVGSNDVIDFDGASTSSTICPRPSQRTVDGVALHDWEDNPATASISAAHPGGNRCLPVGAANCTAVSHSSGTFPAPLIYEDRLDLATDRSIAFIRDTLAACGSLSAYPSATYPAGQALQPMPQAAEAARTGDFGMAGAHYCFDRMQFDVNTPLHASATPANPVIIFVRGDVTVTSGQGGNQRYVGCTAASCTPGSGTPAAGALRIFVLEGNVAIGRFANFAGIMYAPRSDCSGGTGGAQAEIFGAMVCEQMSNIGGWRFHYDDALRNIGGGVFTLSSWREEIPTP